MMWAGAREGIVWVHSLHFHSRPGPNVNIGLRSRWSLVLHKAPFCSLNKEMVNIKRSTVFQRRQHVIAMPRSTVIMESLKRSIELYLCSGLFSFPTMGPLKKKGESKEGGKFGNWGWNESDHLDVMKQRKNLQFGRLFVVGDGSGLRYTKISFVQSHCHLSPVSYGNLHRWGEYFVGTCVWWVGQRSTPSWDMPRPLNRNDGSHSLLVLKKKGGGSRKSISDGVHFPIFLILEYLWS